MATHSDLALYRILDANLDRAREGLRVIEEWCRFGLQHRQLAEQCKHLRHQLAQWHHPSFREARDTQHDPGTQLTHPQEQHRGSTNDLLNANLARVQESLRVLEEYGKLYDSALGIDCKQMRYQMYTLESQLGRRQISLPALYLVTSPSESIMTTVKAALQGGLKLVQYRDKTAPDCERLKIATQLCQLCHQYNALFIVNDRVDLALAADADGVHLGQQDIPMNLARRILGPQRIIGRSTTNVEEMQRAIEEQADYIGVGPVFATPTKPDKAAAGFDYVRYAAQNAPMPWYAIGGIDQDNLQDVLAAGAKSVAVVRAIMNAQDPTKITQTLLATLAAHSPVSDNP